MGEQITGCNQVADPLYPCCEVFAVGVQCPVSQVHGWRRSWRSLGCLQLFFQEIDLAAFARFSPELSPLQIEPQQRVMPGDPEVGYRIGCPGVDWLTPGGGFVAQPACPMAWPEVPQGCEGVVSSDFAGTSTADHDGLRCCRQ